MQQFVTTTFCNCKKKGVTNMPITKDLLIHWWHYYGHNVYSLAELEEFEKVIDTYGADKVFEVAVVNYFLFGNGSPDIMLISIRKGIVNELFESLPDISSLGEKELTLYNKFHQDLLQQIQDSFQNP